ncbi:MAG TPA: ATP-binding protein [Terriglobales bacterium]|nr:ATP-binding protein [Terriglobales bacterium]
MGDLYFDDIEDRSYSDDMILADLEALVKSGQREGTVIDYKSDVSDQDNWPQTVAAFANSFGGLIVFGVEGKNDQPRRVSGFDPKGVEIKTKLTSMVVDRIQPRPDFLVRVVTLDKNSGREVALLRVAEGRTPPYMHSKDQEHRVYTRIGAQKAEADYLQLSSLFEKKQRIASQVGLAVPSGFDSR